MQYISLDGLTIIPREKSRQRVARESGNSGVLQTRYMLYLGNDDLITSQRASRWLDPVEAWEQGEEDSRLSGWRVFTAWAAAAVASWAMVLGFVTLIRALI